VQKLELDLREKTVITECATGIYSCTPILAALAGAKKVVAYGQNSQYGTFKEAKTDISKLCNALNIPQEILLLTNSQQTLNTYLPQGDIITNSGHLRPFNNNRLRMLKAGCVIPLMYEAWEFRKSDLCLKTCLKHDIVVAGTNERHSQIGVFNYLGPLVAKSLFEEGLELTENNILLVCDNDFKYYINKSLTALGANVTHNNNNPDVELNAIVFAHTPLLSGGSLDIMKLNLPRKVPLCLHLWGDIDRSYFITKWVPHNVPEPGHMGIKLSSLGVEPVVRLQGGGLKVGEIISNNILKHNSVRKGIASSKHSGFIQLIEG
jgi:hypothetical protein